MLIRLARIEDSDAIAEIHNQGIEARRATFDTELRTALDRRRVIENDADRFPIIVAEDAGIVVGWGSLTQHSTRRCYRGIAECSVYIDARHHGRGIGRRLIDALIAEARERGYWKLVSRAFLFNEASRALCKRAGFREVGVYERHAQLDGKWLDVIIVERLIPENQMDAPAAD